MQTLADRIKQRMADLDVTQDELAALSGLSQSAIHKLVSGKSSSTRRMPQLASALKCNVYWLTDGTGQPDQITATKTTLQAEPALMMGEFDVWDDDTPLHEDDVELPFFREVELAAGSGRTQVQENHGLKLRFSKRTLKRQGVEINHAACVTVSGNSMEPAMPDGCTIGIDTSKTQINNGKMYAIDHDGELRVKMLYKMPGGLIRLRSYNHEEWPDETVPANAIKILGKVFWYSVLL